MPLPSSRPVLTGDPSCSVFKLKHALGLPAALRGPLMPDTPPPTPAGGGTQTPGPRLPPPGLPLSPLTLVPSKVQTRTPPPQVLKISVLTVSVAELYISRGTESIQSERNNFLGVFGSLWLAARPRLQSRCCPVQRAGSWHCRRSAQGPAVQTELHVEDNSTLAVCHLGQGVHESCLPAGTQQAFLLPKSEVSPSSYFEK